MRPKASDAPAMPALRFSKARPRKYTSKETYGKAAAFSPPSNAGAKVNASIAPCSTTLAATYAAASQTKSYSPYSFDMVYYLSAISSNHFVFRLEYRLARLHGVSKNHFLLPESNLSRAIFKTAMHGIQSEKKRVADQSATRFSPFFHSGGADARYGRTCTGALGASPNISGA